MGASRWRLRLQPDCNAPSVPPCAGRTVAHLRSCRREQPAPDSEVTTMNEGKKNLRDAEDDVKEAWRKADGDESLSDKAANAGDRIRHGIENAGDDIHQGVDDAARRVV